MTLPSNTELNSASQELLDALDTHLPDCIHGEARRDEIICTGEHTFAVYRWTNHSGACRADEMACHLRLQFVMPDNTLWIGRLEICNDFRRQGLGSRIVCSIEMAARASGIRRIRFFSLYSVRRFWQKLGYRNHSRDRFFNKMLAEDN